MKFKQSEIEQLIKEELAHSRRRLVNEILGSTSKVEIEELLRVVFKQMGGVPDDVNRLSVLFPILEKAGLGDIVDAFVEKAQAEGKEKAYNILEPVGEVISKIKMGGKI